MANEDISTTTAKTDAEAGDEGLYTAEGVERELKALHVMKSRGLIDDSAFEERKRDLEDAKQKFGK